jgi:hypothetical protein
MFARRLRSLSFRPSAARPDKPGSPQMSDSAHILIVDDQQEICDVVEEY